MNAVFDRELPIADVEVTRDAARTRREVRGDEVHDGIARQLSSAEIVAVAVCAAAERTSEMTTACDRVCIGRNRVLQDCDGKNAFAARSEAPVADEGDDHDGDGEPERDPSGDADDSIHAAKLGIQVAMAHPRIRGWWPRRRERSLTGMQDTLEHALLSVSDTLAIDDILAFWIGEPATDARGLLAKLQRWFQGGETIDRLIEKRFGAIVERALAGELDHWLASTRGRIALVIVLDQFTRNLFRNTPRAYAGDEAARALAMSLVESGLWRLGSTEQRLVVGMPFAHAEDLELQSRSVAIAQETTRDAPEALHGPLSIGCGRTEHYRSIIARFGRFPHRNGILGRRSTSEELAFLEEEAKRPPPLPPTTVSDAAMA